MAKQDKLITQEWIDRVSAALVELGQSPPPRTKTFTRQKAIEEIAPIIRELQHKEFSLDDILPVINIDGQNFTRAAIKTYLTRVAPSPSEGQARGVRKGQRRPDTISSAKGRRPEKLPSASPDSSTDGSHLRAPLAEGTDTL